MKKYDVAVIGAGPIGGYVAGKIAAKNYKVALFEKNKRIGIPVNCAGLVTPRVFDFLSFSKDKCIQNKIKGANIHSPSDKILTIGGDKVHALVINRTLFDQEITKNSEKKGVNLYLKNKLLSINRKKNFVEFKTSHNENIRCKLLIGADGPKSKIRQWSNLPEPIEYLRGIGAEIKKTNLNSEFVEIFLGKKIAPGFFAWIIPTNKKGTKARIGLCIDENAKYSPKYYFENFLKNNYLKNAIVTKHIGGIIPLGVLKKTYDENIMVVGDAAAQVKPTSGGGIYPGLLCGSFCSNIAINALENNNFSESFLKKYHKEWTSEYGRDLNFGMRFRRRFKNLSDKQFDKYIEILSNQKIIDTISSYGDIDYPSKLVKPLLKKLPTILKLMSVSNKK